jgi:hypothetical protein
VAPTVSVSDQYLTFGNEAVGLTTAPLQTTVTNTGTGPLIISSISLSGSNPADFAETNDCPMSAGGLAPGASCSISATFTPSDLGSRKATLTIVDNVVSGNQLVFLSGTGTTPAAVSLSPTSLTFSDTDVNSVSAPLTVTLTNTGNGTLAIDSIALTGLNPKDYSQTNTCGTSVAAGKSCTISVTFQPQYTGSRKASVTITDNASPATQTVTLTGSGVAPVITVTSASLSFPNTTKQTTSAPLTTTVTNTGTGPLIITSIALGGDNPGDFAQTNTCPTSPHTLAVNASCAITATFTPTVASFRKATITINSNVLAGPKTITLTGTGIGFTVKLSPTTLAFPSTVVGVTSTAKTVTLTNQGSVSLKITSVSMSGVNPADFAQTNTCGTSVAPNASCTVTVTFTPKATGSRSASLAIADNGDNSPQAVPLSGTGTQPVVTVSPASLTYAIQEYNTSSKTQKVTLTNAGTASLTITSFTFSGVNPSEFVQTNTCPISPSTLLAGRSCTVTLTFMPKGMGARSANLNINDNAPGAPQQVSLHGTGTFANLSPASLSYAGTKVGKSSPTKIVTFTNIGNALLTMRSISITGANPFDFTQTNTCGSTVAAGAKCTVTVTFKPTALGTRTANPYFDDSDGAGPQTVSLAGTGI